MRQPIETVVEQVQAELDRRRWPFPLRATVSALGDWLLLLVVETFAENQLVQSRTELTTDIVEHGDLDYIVERAVLELTRTAVRGRP